MNELLRLTDAPNQIHKLERELEKDIYKKSYYEFYKVAFAQLTPGERYSDNWHAEYICGVLQEEAFRIHRKERNTKDIIINIPFRSSKSLLVTIIFPVWCWACVDPSMKFISTSFAEKLAIEHSGKSMTLIQSIWFQGLYGSSVVLKPGQQAKGHYETTDMGVRKVAGTGGQITGSGCDVIIVDDPQDPGMASSEVERENTIKFYNETLYSRLNDFDVGVRILVQQRLNQLDLSGYLMDKKTGRPNDHLHICIPGELDKEILSPPELVKYYIDGLFWPQRFHREVLNQLRKSQGELAYAGQMNQRPAPKEGNLVKKAWFAIKRPHEISRDSRKNAVNFFMDTAYTEKQTNDPSGILACYEQEGKIYILNTAEVWYEFPKLVDFTQQYVALNDYTSASLIYVEPKASGKSLVQTLRRVSGLNICEIDSLMLKDDKMTRLSSVSASIQAGKVVLVEGPWNEAFLTQVCSFPNAAHDEFVDLLCYAIDQLLVNNQGDLMGMM